METNRPFLCIHEGGSSVWKKGERKKLRCIWGHVEAEEEFVAGEMCASLKAAMGMPAADGNESAMVARFLSECMMETSVTNIFYTLC